MASLPRREFDGMSCRIDWQTRCIAAILVCLVHAVLVFSLMGLRLDTPDEPLRIVQVIDVPIDQSRSEMTPLVDGKLELELQAPSLPQPSVPEWAIEEAPRDGELLTVTDSNSIAIAPHVDARGDVPLTGTKAQERRVSDGDVFTKCTNRTMPDYPADAKNRNEHGKVVLLVQLDQRGKFASVVVARSSGSRSLDAASVSAIKRWRCSPVIENGHPVPAIAKQEFEFILRQ